MVFSIFIILNVDFQVTAQILYYCIFRKKESTATVFRYNPRNY